MQSVNIAAAIPLIKVLKFCGLWFWRPDTTKGNSFLQYVYRYALQVPLSFVCIALMWVEVLKAKDLIQVGEVLYITFTETVFVVKMLNIWLLRSKAFAYMHEIGSNIIFELRTQQEFKFWRHEQKIFLRISMGYIGGSFAVVVFAFVGVLLLPEYALPFKLYVPFDWHNARNYWIIYIYEFFALTLTCISNTTLDMIQCYFLFHLALLYKLIGKRLTGLKHLDEDAALLEMRRIFKLHQSVRRLTVQCQELISIPILAQIILSALVLCFSGYRLLTMSFTQDTGRFFATLQFLSVMALQIFLPCHYGNEISVNGDQLANDIYNSNWQRFSVPTRKIIIIYMELLKSPIKIKVGGFFVLGLPIFSKTINNAYSFFAILLNMQQENV